MRLIELLIGKYIVVAGEGSKDVLPAEVLSADLHGKMRVRLADGRERTVLYEDQSSGALAKTRVFEGFHEAAKWAAGKRGKG